MVLLPPANVSTFKKKFYICSDVTHTHTLDKNGSLYDPAGTESCDMQIRLVSYLDKDENIYMGLW